MLCVMIYGFPGCYMCMIYFNCSVLLPCCQSPPMPTLISFFKFNFCCCHHHLMSPFCFLPTWCHPSPLSTPSSKPTTTLPGLSVSQRHSQTGGGVKRRWAAGDRSLSLNALSLSPSTTPHFLLSPPFFLFLRYLPPSLPLLSSFLPCLSAAPC